VVEGLEATSVLAGPSTFCGAATVTVELTAPDGTKVPANSVEMTATQRLGPNFQTLDLRAASVPSVSSGSALAVEPERIWSTPGFVASANLGQARLNVTQRPLAVGRGPSSFIDLMFDASLPSTIGGTLGDRVGLGLPGFVLVPYQNSPDTIDFVALEDPGLARTITREWLISGTADPFTLLSTPMPSIP
jgi:hypothetical protein